MIVFFHRDDGKEYHLINWYSRTSFKLSHSISLVLLMIPLTVGVKVYLIHFLFRRELVVLVWIVWRNLSTPDFFDPEIVIWGLTSLTDFHKRIRLFVKKRTCVRLPKENLFWPNNASEFYICISWQHQKLLLVTNQLQGDTFFIRD